MVETCILSSNCTDNTPCECQRDFVVRYNVTIEHGDDKDDEHGVVHSSVIQWQSQGGDRRG
jgi:hypothetical protein